MDHHRQRIEAERLQHDRLGFAVTFGAVIETPERDVRTRAAGVQFDRSLHVLDRSRQIQVLSRDGPQRRICLSQRIIQLQRLHRSGARLLIRFGRRSDSPGGANHVTLGDSRPRRCVLRVELQRPLEMPQSEFDGLRGMSGDDVPALQVLDVRLGVHRAPLRQSRDLPRRHLHRDLFRDGRRDSALEQR